MGKSLSIQYVPYISSPKKKLHEVDLVTKPNEAALKGFQALECGTRAAVGISYKGHSNGVQMEVDAPVVLCDVGTYMEVDAKSSPTLRGSGNTSSLPLFNGFDTREFVSWLYAIECCFEASDFSEHEKCDMVVLCLRNDTLKWYNSITFGNWKNGKIIFKYWHKLRCCLKEKYLNKAVMSDLKIELENLKMDSFCVKDYAMRFKELYFICGSPKDSSEKINFFYIGLNSEIQGWIDIEQIISLELLCKLALYSENLIHEHEVYMESLAKTDAKHAVFVGRSNGLDCELPLTHGVTLGDNGVNIGNVMVQKIVKDTKLGYKPYPCGMGLLSVGLEGFNTNETRAEHKPCCLKMSTLCLKENMMGTKGMSTTTEHLTFHKKVPRYFFKYFDPGGRVKRLNIGDKSEGCSIDIIGENFSTYQI